MEEKITNIEIKEAMEKTNPKNDPSDDTMDSFEGDVLVKPKTWFEEFAIRLFKFGTFFPTKLGNGKCHRSPPSTICKSTESSFC